MKSGLLAAAVILSGLCAGAAAQEDKIAELEKQLRATQDFFSAELLAIRNEGKKGEDGKKSSGEGGKKKELFPVMTGAKKAQLKVLIKTKYEYIEKGKTFSGSVVAPKTGFSMVNTRLWVDGELSKGLGYRLKVEFSNKGTGVQLQEAYGSYAFVPGKLIFMAGQRQPKTTGNGPAEYLPFVDMLNSSDTMKWALNDRGIAFQGRLLAKTMFYEAQLMNGNGASGTLAANDNTSFLYSLHARYEPFGEMSPAQNDIKLGKFQLGLGAAAARSRDKKIGKFRQDKTWWSGNAIIKWRGLFAKALLSSQDADNTNSAKDQLHWSIHSGYAIPVGGGRVLEPLFRYQVLDLNRDASGWTEKITTAGLNYYLDGYSSRLMVNYNFKQEEGTRRIDNDTFQVMYALFF